MNDRWQYQVVDVKTGAWTLSIKSEALQDQLNKLGQTGWELVTVRQVSTNLQLILKRRA